MTTEAIATPTTVHPAIRKVRGLISSALGQKFASSGLSDWSIVEAESFDGSEDLVGGLCPSEGFGIDVVLVDVRQTSRNNLALLAFGTSQHYPSPKGHSLRRAASRRQ